MMRLTILEYPVTATATTFIWVSNVILIEELSTMKVYKIVFIQSYSDLLTNMTHSKSISISLI